MNVLIDADADDPFPKLCVFGVSVFELCELGARLVIHFGLAFSLIVEALIERNKPINSLLFYHLAAAPFFICDKLLSKGSSPVAEVVYADALISRKLEKSA